MNPMVTITFIAINEIEGRHVIALKEEYNNSVVYSFVDLKYLRESYELIYPAKTIFRVYLSHRSSYRPSYFQL